MPGADRLPEDPCNDPQPKFRIYSFEAAGILVVGALILVFTLVRYWHYIRWDVR